MLFRPKFKNGEYATLSWPIALYRVMNNICWPLNEDVSVIVRLFDRFCFTFFIIIYFVDLDAQLRFVFININDIDQFMEAIIVLVVQGELFLRVVQLSLRRQDFKHFLHSFYDSIYVMKTTHPKRFRSIRKKLRPTLVYTCTYIITLVLYVAAPFISLLRNRRDLPFPMIFSFDITPLSIYLPINFATTWMSFVLVSMMFGDANVLSEAILHLREQYLLLNEDLQGYSKELLAIKGNGAVISRDFGVKVKQIFKRNIALKQFQNEFQDFFSYRIFLMYVFAALVICVLGFKTYTKNAVLYNVLWMLSKVAEMLVMGELGSSLIATSNNVSSMYYNSNWELIISCSTDASENVQLMKLLAVAIEMNQKSFVLKGLNFFTVSLSTVMKILQAAASYFTCLISIRERK